MQFSIFQKLFLLGTLLQTAWADARIAARQASATSAAAARFTPETSTAAIDSLIASLPTQYNISDSQAVIANKLNSYWSTSFVRASDNHDYFVLSHTIFLPQFGAYRGSILDITDPTYYFQFTSLTTLAPNSTRLDFTFPGYHFGLVGSNPLGSINTWATTANVTFNISYDLSAPVLLNAGDGTFLGVEHGEVVNEWAMPAGRTSGSLVARNKTLTIDPTKSLTWYDRQWQPLSTASLSWTWFELHLTAGPTKEVTKASIWFYPSGYGTNIGFASLSGPSGSQANVPATYKAGTRTWQSPNNYTYALDWTVDLADGTTLNISSVRPDQELSDPSGSLRTYEGFINVTGKSGDGKNITGFGNVEIEPPTS